MVFVCLLKKHIEEIMLYVECGR